MSKNLVPSIGTTVRFCSRDVSLSKDQVTYVCRITFDEQLNDWVIASRFNEANGRWLPITKLRRIGMIVLLNDKPGSEDTHIKITAIQKTGKGAFGDPIQIKSDALVRG